METLVKDSLNECCDGGRVHLISCIGRATNTASAAIFVNVYYFFLKQY